MPIGYNCNVIHYSDGDSLLITLAAENDFPSDVGGALGDQITATAEASGINVTVLVIRFGRHIHIEMMHGTRLPV